MHIIFIMCIFWLKMIHIIKIMCTLWCQIMHIIKIMCIINEPYMPLITIMCIIKIDVYRKASPSTLCSIPNQVLKNSDIMVKYSKRGENDHLYYTNWMDGEPNNYNYKEASLPFVLLPFPSPSHPSK